MLPMRWLVILSVSLLLVSALSRADTLLTTEGRMLEGVVRIEGGGAGLIMVPRSGSSLHAEADKIISLTMSARTIKRERGVLLTGGAFIPIDSFLKLQGNVLRMTRSGGVTFDLLLTQASLLLFDDAAGLQMPGGDTPGVLLASGDFFEGELSALNDHTLTLTSTLFGERHFRTDREVVAIRLRNAGAPQGKWIVRLTNGTVARASGVQIAGGVLQFDDPAAGPMTATLNELVELRRGESPLTPLQPRDTRARAEFPLWLRGPRPPWATDPDKSGGTILLQGPAPHELELDNSVKAVLLRGGVPGAMVPSRALRLSVLVDGKSIFRSAPLTSVDDAVMLSVPVAGKKTLTLQVEGDTDAIAVWTDVALVK